jgi:hypothetical protein
MNELLLYVDYLGQEPKLRTNGKKRFQTSFGGLISIISTISIFIVGGYFVLQTFERKQFTVISSTSTIDDPFYDFNKYPPYMVVVDKESNPIKDADRVFQFSAIMGHQSGTSAEFKPMNLKKNTDLKYKPDNFQNATIAQQKNILYFDTDEPINKLDNGFRGTWGKPLAKVSHLLIIQLTKCVNTTENANNCLSMEEINQRLTGIQYIFYYSEFDLDHNNVTEPGHIRYSSEDNDLSPTVFKKWWFGFKTFQYNSDMGYVFEDFQKQTYWAFLPYLFDVELISGGENQVGGLFAYIGVYGDTRLDVYDRKYFKIQELLANVGGIINGIVLLARFLVIKFSETFIALKYYERIYLKKQNKQNLKQDYSGRTINSQMIHLTSKLQSKNSIRDASPSNINRLNIEHIKIIKNNSNQEKNNINQDNNFPKKLGIKISTLKVNKISNITLSIWQYILPLNIQNSTSFIILRSLMKKINKKISMENIIEKINLIDKIKFVIFNEHELNLLKCVPNSRLDHLPDCEKEIDRLWKIFEYENRNKGDFNELNDYLKNYNSKPFTDRIIALSNLN